MPGKPPRRAAQKRRAPSPEEQAGQGKRVWLSQTERDRHITRQRKMGASPEQEYHVTGGNAASLEATVPTTAPVSIRDVMSALGSKRFGELEARIGAGGIARLAARLGKRGIAVPEWGARWREVQSAAGFASDYAREEWEPRKREEAGARIVPPKEEAARSPLVDNLRKYALSQDVDALVSVLGVQETHRLLVMLSEHEKNPALSVARRIRNLTTLAKRMDARDLFNNQGMWRGR